MWWMKQIKAIDLKVAWLHWVKCIWVYCALHSQSTHYIWFPKLIRGFFFPIFSTFEALSQHVIWPWGAAFEVRSAQKWPGSGAGAPGACQQHTVLLPQLRWLTAGYGGQRLCPNTYAEKKHRQSKNVPGRAFWKCDIFLHVKILGGSYKYLYGMDFGIFMRKDLVHFLLLHTISMNELYVCISNNLMCNHQFVLKCHKYFPIKTAQHNALYFIKQLLAVIVRSNFPFFI